MTALLTFNMFRMAFSFFDFPLRIANGRYAEQQVWFHLVRRYRNVIDVSFQHQQPVLRMALDADAEFVGPRLNPIRPSAGRKLRDHLGGWDVRTG